MAGRRGGGRRGGGRRGGGRRGGGRRGGGRRGGKGKAAESETEAAEGTQPLQTAGKRGGKDKAAASEAEAVDFNNEDYSIPSPESTELLAGSSKKGTTQSPKTRQKRKAAASETEAVDFDNEDYNIPSPERTKLLTKIKGIISNAPVSPALWACCQLADMHRLKAITKWEEEAILGYNESLAIIAAQWNQKFHGSKTSGSETVSQRPEGSKRRKLNSDGQLLVLWSAKEAEKCKERDGHKCILTQGPYPRATHIFPYSMLNPPAESDGLKASNMMPRFWKLLRIFWDKDRVEKWHKTIMPDSQHPNTGVEGCFNQISLSPNAHGMWTRGEFALKPLELSSNRKELTVQFFWQVPGNYKINSQIDLLTEPASSEGLEIVTKESHKYWLDRRENDRSLHLIRSGETFTFTTKDPTNLPLPSLELLEMQWVLQRLVGMSGAAGWPSLDDDDDDDDTVDTDDDTADIDDSWLIPAD